MTCGVFRCISVYFDGTWCISVYFGVYTDPFIGEFRQA